MEDWATLDEYIAECKEGAGDPGRYERRVNGMSFEGDTAPARLGAQYGCVYVNDDLSLVNDDGTWRIVHQTATRTLPD